MSWVSKAVCCLTFSQLLALSSSNTSCLEALNTNSKHWQLQYLNSFCKLTFAFMAHFHLFFMWPWPNNDTRDPAKTRTLFGSDSAWWRLERASIQCSMYLRSMPKLSLYFPSPALTDTHCSALKQMVEALGPRILRNERSKIIISDISIQPLVQASMSTSKSIQANLDSSPHSLSFSSLFLFKSHGSLLVKIISNNLQCVEHTRNIKTIM